MSATPTLPASPSSDARRAGFRSRDAIRAALSRSGVSSAGVEVDVTEPEAALPVAGLARALVEASARPSVRLVPGGGFPGAPFPAGETYVTSWELQLLDEERAAGHLLGATARGARGERDGEHGRARGTSAARRRRSLATRRCRPPSRR